MEMSKEEAVIGSKKLAKLLGPDWRPDPLELTNGTYYLRVRLGNYGIVWKTGPSYLAIVRSPNGEFETIDAENASPIRACKMLISKVKRMIKEQEKVMKYYTTILNELVG